VNQLANAARSQFSLRRFMGAETRWGMCQKSHTIRSLCCTLAGVLLLTLPAAAQLQVGDLHMNLNGNLGFNYGGGNSGGLSDHSMGFSGNGMLTGNYYSPNFLSFNVSPFYNREQTNSIFGSLSNATGLSSNVNLFNGSHFPGSVSYNSSYNGISSFGVPGSDLGLAERTNTNSFAVGWSALLPNMPTFTAIYGIDHSSNSIIGESGNDDVTNRTLNLLSTYRWDGFNMMGQFQHRNTDADFTQFLEEGEAPITTKSSSNNIGATIQHPLPFSGNFGVSWNRLSYGYSYQDSTSASNSGSSDTVNGNAGFHFTDKVGVSFNATYNDSLLGSIPQTFLNSGTTVNLTEASSFHSVLVGTDVFYQIFKNLGVHADVAHEDQTFLGQTYAATQFGASVNYNFDHTLLKGLSFSFGLVDTVQQTANIGLGFVGNLNYARKFLGWDVGANFSYAQNVQTTMLVYTTSTYSYLASVRHRFGERQYFMAGYSGSHSGLSANSGTTSSAERIFAGYIFRGNSFNAYYDKSNGLAVFTNAGLIPVPTTLPTQLLVPNSFSQYGSTGYGFSLGVAPTRRLQVSASYAKSDGSTIDPSLSIFTNNTLINATMQYRLRKIFVNAGYTRLNQSAGTAGSVPTVVTSYFIGFSRWFNFF
jgi:hypothetical protein